MIFWDVGALSSSSQPKPDHKINCDVSSSSIQNRAPTQDHASKQDQDLANKVF